MGSLFDVFFYGLMALFLVFFVGVARYQIRHFRLVRTAMMKVLTSHEQKRGSAGKSNSAHNPYPRKAKAPSRWAGIIGTVVVFFLYLQADVLFGGYLVPNVAAMLAVLFTLVYCYHSFVCRRTWERLVLAALGFLGYKVAVYHYDNIMYYYVDYNFQAGINLIAYYILKIGALVNLALFAIKALQGLSGVLFRKVDQGFDEFENAFHGYLDYVLKSRKSGRYSYQRSEEEKAKESGKEGEANVRYHLKWLQGYKVLHNVRIPNPLESQEIDHIVIGKNGVFHLETKNHGGKYGARIVINKEGDWSIIQHNGHAEGMANPLFQVRRHERVLREFLEKEFPGVQVPLKEIVVLSNEKTILEGQENSPITVLKVERLNDFIMNYQSGITLDEKTVNSIYAKLAPLSQTSPA